MDLPDNVSEYLKHIVKIIKETMPVSAIYLFGSYATGEYHKDSDLDIYIVTPYKSKSRTKHAIAVSMAIGFEKLMPMDIIVGYDDRFEHRKNVINTVENEIIEKGVNIYAYS